MKEKVLKILLTVIMFVGVGCQPNSNLSHKDTFIVATKVAINHLDYEKNEALVNCDEISIPAEECEDAVDYERWIEILSTFEQHINDADNLTIGVEEISFIIDVIVGEMEDGIDPRAKVYIEDLKVILGMLIQDDIINASM